MIINVFGEFINPDHIVKLVIDPRWQINGKVLALGEYTAEFASREIASWNDTSCEAIADEINKQIKETLC